MAKLISFINIEDFKKILKAEKDNKYKLAYVMAFGSGLRISEILGLREYVSRCCGDMVFQKTNTIGGVKRKRSYCPNCEKQLFITDLVRSKTMWKIPPITANQIDLETKQIRVLGKGGKERITVINPIFPLRESMLNLLPLKINRRTFQYHFTKHCKKVLGKPLNFHTLRHGFANHMLNERNLPMPMVQGFGGWARLDTVGIYAKANPVQAIEKVWEGF